MFGMESKEELLMLSQNTANDRLSKEFLALTEITKTLISQIEFSEVLSPVIKKTVSLIEQTEIVSKVFWGQSLGMFQA